VRSEQRQFDLNQLSRSIVGAGRDRGLTWAEISKEVGVATSTIRRFAIADDAEADGVLALVGRVGVAPEYFVVDSKIAGVPLPDPGDGRIRVDMSLVVDLAGGPRQAGGRTAIQQLVMLSQAAGVSVASLTRWSPV
jgi:hypothetical protein